MHEVISIGSATRDNFLLMKYQLIDWPKTPSRQAIVFPWGEKISVDKIYFTLGGNAANASVTFSRQGFASACVAKIGRDHAGKEFLSYLKKEKVDVSLIKKHKTLNTAYSALLLDEETGERTILNNHGASDAFNLKDLKLEKMKAKWWYLSLSGESYKMFPKILDFARENQIKVAFNPSGYHLKHGREEILSRLKDISFLVLNEGEAAELVGIPFEKEKEVFAKLDALMPGIVAVTDGPNGVTVSDGKNLYRAGIFSGQKVVDRTGAGDAFGSGFVAGLIYGKQEVGIRNYGEEDIKYAIRLATANATSVVEQIGATEGILTKEKFTSDPRWQKLEISTESLLADRV